MSIVQISDQFPGGNIIVDAIDDTTAKLRIRADVGGEWMQWFCFSVEAAADDQLTLIITNAGDTSYAAGWPGYAARVDDGTCDAWRMAATDYCDGRLTIRHRMTVEKASFAFFAPYCSKKHRLLMVSARGTVRSLGRSPDGNPIEYIRYGNGPKQVWITCRQHPGETMASWWAEGAIGRLNALVAEDAPVFDAATVHVVPLANPDGAVRGHLRCNALGTDLNRYWRDPDPVKAPEVVAILRAMEATGVDVLLDVHGEECVRQVFIDGCDGSPVATPGQIAGVQRFRRILTETTSAFRKQDGYPPSYAGDAAETMAARGVAARFGAIGMTLEMPFGDSIDAPDPRFGWSSAASAKLGGDCIHALAQFIVEDLILA
jgi:murein tripeptide amidase MpaA